MPITPDSTVKRAAHGYARTAKQVLVYARDFTWDPSREMFVKGTDSVKFDPKRGWYLDLDLTSPE